MMICMNIEHKQQQQEYPVPYPSLFVKFAPSTPH